MKLGILAAIPLVLASYLPAQQPTEPAEKPSVADTAERTKPARAYSLNLGAGAGTGWRYAPTGIDLTRASKLSEQNNTLGLTTGNLLRKGDSLAVWGWNTCTLDGRILDTPKRDCSEADAAVRYNMPLGRALKGDVSAYIGAEEWFFTSGDLGERNTIVSSGAGWRGPYGLGADIQTNAIAVGGYAGGFGAVAIAKDTQTIKTFKNKSHLDASVSAELGYARHMYDDASGLRVARGELGASYTWKSGTIEQTVGAKWRPQISLAPGTPSTPEFQVGYTVTIPLGKK